MQHNAIFFTGVNPGFPGEASPVKEPEAAARIAQAVLDKVRRETKDANSYRILPGLAVYHHAWGCPDGGEAVAVIATEGDADAAIRTAEAMRRALRQANIAVGIYGEAEEATSTLAFFATTDTELKPLAQAWQDAANAYFAETEIYISAGMYHGETGALRIQAEANPEHIDDRDKWKAGVLAVAKIAGEKAHLIITPHFREAGLVYLAG